MSLTIQQRRRMAERTALERSVASSVEELCNPKWPAMSPDDLRALLDWHGPEDFERDAVRGAYCDSCELQEVALTRFAAWFCQECNVGLCDAHFAFMVLSNENSTGGLLQ
jgi:hypothetical protein